MIFLASESWVRVVFGSGEDTLSTVGHLEVSSDWKRWLAMASIPMGAHAAFKVRDNLNGGPPGAEKADRFAGAFSAKSMATDVQLYQPAQYNGKLMNSIWGMYNRYSVHNIKSHIAFDKA